MRSTGDVLAALREVAAVDVASLADARVRAEVLDLVRVVNLAQVALGRRIGSFDRRGLAEADGYRSTRSWLVGFGRFSPHAAAGVQARAAVLDQLPALTVAGQRGDVSSEHLARIAALVDDVGIGAVQAADEVLAELTATARPADVGAACDRIRAHIDPDGAEPDPEAVLQRRGLTLSRSGDMVRLRGQLDPEAGAVVMTALDAVMTPPSAHDDRTAAQRRADALTDLARLPLTRDMLPVAGGTRPQIGLLVTPQALLRQPPLTGTGSGHPVPDWIAGLAHHRSDRATDIHPADPPGPGQRQEPRDAVDDPLAAIGIPPTPEPGWLTWTGPISTATTQRIACDSVIYRVLYDPVTGQPLDVGRSHRTAPPWIRRALHARDRGCRWPGCTAPTPWCDAHHLTMWQDGGHTTVDSMLILCRLCRRRHNRHYADLGIMPRSVRMVLGCKGFVVGSAA
jgi:hypothetical protein